MNHLFLVAGTFPVYFVAVYVVGFVAAIVIGSIAWYSSKRPVGWEDSEKPDLFQRLKLTNPKIKTMSKDLLKKVN